MRRLRVHAGSWPTADGYWPDNKANAVRAVPVTVAFITHRPGDFGRRSKLALPEASVLSDVERPPAATVPDSNEKSPSILVNTPSSPPRGWNLASTVAAIPA